MPAKRDWYWVTRADDEVQVWASEEKPTPVHGSHGLFWNAPGNIAATWGQTTFKQMFGLMPPKYQPIKVRFTAEVIKE